MGVWLLAPVVIVQKCLLFIVLKCLLLNIFLGEKNISGCCTCK